MKQGEIRAWGRTRVVILSSDQTSTDAYPIVAPLSRETEDFSPYQVPLSETDPFAGSVELARLTWAPPGQLGETLGLVTGATLHRLTTAVAGLFTRH